MLFRYQQLWSYGDRHGTCEVLQRRNQELCDWLGEQRLAHRQKRLHPDRWVGGWVRACISENEKKRESKSE